MTIWESAKEFFHLSVPATVDEDAGVITVPAFIIPLGSELPSHPEPLEGIIAIDVEPATKVAVVKVALKKKVKKPITRPVVKRRSKVKK